MELNKGWIKCCDCVEGMKSMEAKSVDVSFTSPPYNDTGTSKTDMHTNNTHRKYEIPEMRKDWFNWQCEVIDQMLRVTKKYVLYNVQGLKNNRENIYKLIGHYSERIHDILVWYKPNGCPTGTPNKLSNKYEMVLILKPDGVKGVDVNSKFYTNVIVQNINSNKEFAQHHKAVMSKPFCDEIIKEFTKEGDIVLDPFMGMATTAVSCIEQNRKFIGFEIYPKYFELAQKRIKETINCLTN